MGLPRKTDTMTGNQVGGYQAAVEGMSGSNNQYQGTGIYTTKPPAAEASPSPAAITDTQISDAAGAAGAEEMKKARGRAATIFGGMKGGSGSVAKRTLLSI